LLIENDPYVLPLYSTGHTVAKAWMSHARRLRHPETNGILPIFAHRFGLTTTVVTKPKGSWFGWVFTDLGLIESLEEQIAADEFQKIVAGGALRVGYDGDPIDNI
jgi:hypothetical protein